jgi:hydrogenase-1 operon protein HyaF
MRTPNSTMSNDDNIVSFETALGKKQGDTLDIILTEIKNALHNLLKSGRETIIDLDAVACDDACEESLKKILGKGDVNATLTIFGRDEILESGIHGVWWVYHKNEAGTVVTKSIYIAYVPSILPAQREDVEYSTTVLEKRLAGNKYI